MSAAPTPGFFVSEAELASSPSRQDGVSVADEERLLLYGCSLIARSAVALAVPQAVAVTAQVILRRFFCRRSLARFDVRVAAAAVCWLAAKLEEVVDIDASEDERLSLRDVLLVFHRAVHRLNAEASSKEGGAGDKHASIEEGGASDERASIEEGGASDERASSKEGAASLPASSVPNATPAPPAAKLPVLDPYSAPYAEFKALVVRVERHVLRALGFQTDVEAPHRCVLQYGAMALGLDARAQQLAWNVASDAARSRLCLLHSPGTVAAGVLFYVARKFLKQPLPARPHWWLPLGVQTAEVCSVAAQLHALYAQPAPRFVAVGRGPEPAVLQTLQAPTSTRPREPPAVELLPAVDIKDAETSLISSARPASAQPSPAQPSPAQPSPAPSHPSASESYPDAGKRRRETLSVERSRRDARHARQSRSRSPRRPSRDTSRSREARRDGGAARRGGHRPRHSPRCDDGSRSHRRD